MSARSLWLYFTLLVFLALGLQASAETDEHETKSLQDLHRTLNIPSQLKGWRTYGGDPCAESWTGVTCKGSSVVQLEIPGLQLGGNLGYRLSDLRNLKKLDMSSNRIQGPIPYALPANLTYLNLAHNMFSQNLPYSLTNMKHLQLLNVSHNSLSGPIGDVFTGLTNLKEMDLSYNNFTGDLPSSFQGLINLSKLFLESNGFTGSVTLLSELPLSDLDIQDNHFSGVIPPSFRGIPNLWLGGNRFHRRTGDIPWFFPWFDFTPHITSPPPPSNEATTATNGSSPPYCPKKEQKTKDYAPGAIICIVCGVTLFLAAILFAVARIKQRVAAAVFLAAARIQQRGRSHRRQESSPGSGQSLPSTAREESSVLPDSSSPRVIQRGTTSSTSPRGQAFQTPILTETSEGLKWIMDHEMVERYHTAAAAVTEADPVENPSHSRIWRLWTKKGAMFLAKQ
nr:PREDICTED: protein STRUBBELIG-RECEPTOR FAMILY 2-like isoform X2 [Daucus carota subsp. sativus]